MVLQNKFRSRQSNIVLPTTKIDERFDTTITNINVIFLSRYYLCNVKSIKVLLDLDIDFLWLLSAVANINTSKSKESDLKKLV